MTGMIYKILEAVYGSGITESVSKWMDKLWGTLNVIFQTNNLVNSAYIAFAGVASALLVLYFYIEITSQASRDLFTLEKLVIMFIKYIVAFLILIYSKEIMNGILAIGQGVYEKTKDATFSNGGESNCTWDYMISKHPGNDSKGRNIYVMNTLKRLYSGGVSEFIEALGVVIPGILGLIVAFACKLSCYLICTTNVLNICVRAYMSPLAIPQLFEEGQRSSGIRYFKSFAATCLEMALIIITLRLASQIAVALQPALLSISSDGSFGTGFLVDEQGKLNEGNIEIALSIMGLIPALVPHLAAVTAIAGVNRITHDIVG